MNNRVFARKNKKSDFELTDKLLVHQKGWQHAAFSIFIFNEKNELLLQKRAAHKYHSPNLWTNTCCSHPLSLELDEIKRFAENRLKEEMGFSTELDFLFKFEYNVKCSNDLIENEIDFVFTGKIKGNPKINFNKEQVSEYKWMLIDNLMQDVLQNEQKYTEWLKIILKNYRNKF